MTSKVSPLFPRLKLFSVIRRLLASTPGNQSDRTSAEPVETFPDEKGKCRGRSAVT